MKQSKEKMPGYSETGQDGDGDEGWRSVGGRCVLCCMSLDPCRRVLRCKSRLSGVESVVAVGAHCCFCSSSRPAWQYFCCDQENHNRRVSNHESIIARVMGDHHAPGCQREKHARSHVLLVLASWRARSVHPLLARSLAVLILQNSACSFVRTSCECDDCDVSWQTGKRQ